MSALRVATYNLDGLGGRAFQAGGPRIAALRDMLSALDADVLCLQEVNAENGGGSKGRTLKALDDVLRGSPYERFHRIATAHRDGSGLLDVHNLVILSRRPFAASRQIWHDFVPAPVHRPLTAEPPAGDAAPCPWTRPALYAAIEVEDAPPVHLFNLHLRAPLAAFVAGQKESAFVWKSARGWAEGFYLATLQRTGQALEARLAVDELLDRDGDARIVVCGDMNADRAEMPVRILEASAEDTGNPSLAARALFPIEEIAPEADRFSVIHAGHRHMLDHILVSRALAAGCRSVAILNVDLPDEVFDEAAEADRWASNHAPVVAEFDV